MTKGLLAVFSAVLLMFPAATMARAATLEAIQGEVLVNRGGGYRFVSGTVELKPGDMVIANGGGAAQLSYGDGCSVSIQAGSVATVAEQSPCPTQTNTGTQGLSPGTLAVGAAVVGGAVGAAVLLGNKSDKSASP